MKNARDERWVGLPSLCIHHLSCVLKTFWAETLARCNVQRLRWSYLYSYFNPVIHIPILGSHGNDAVSEVEVAASVSCNTKYNNDSGQWRAEGKNSDVDEDNVGESAEETNSELCKAIYVEPIYESKKIY